MITVEMMVARLERGDTLRKAATFAYTSTAFPMLTGTLVTVAGFLPIGFNGSGAGEYTYSLFVVIAASLLVSWVVAVLFAPLVGVTLLPKTMKHHTEKRGIFTRLFMAALRVAMRWHWTTVVVCLALMAAAIVGMGHVQQQFFPSSDRSEVLVDLTLPQNATIAETRAQMDRFETNLKGDPDVSSWSSYVGQGAVRFYLPLDQQLANAFFGQIVIVTKSLEVRDRVMARLQAIALRDFVGTDVLVQPLSLGPPVGRPVQYRLSGPNMETVRRLSLDLANVVAGDKRLDVPTFDWNEPGKVLRVEILQDKARQLGVTSQDVAGILNGIEGGQAITQVRDSIYLVNVVGRARAVERSSLDTLQSLQSVSRTAPCPRARLRTDRLRSRAADRLAPRPSATVTVRATIHDATQPATIVAALQPGIDAFIKALPEGYTVQTGGAVEESAKGQGPIAAVVPVMLLAMAFLLMMQLQSFGRMILVFTVAPLGLIGVVPALLLFDKPMGFVAILGILALIGIIIRNAVILVSQIEEFRAEGMAPWEAVFEATHHRMRPILLTAAAASLGLIPIAREVFWGPMAFA